jgi:membrane protease YdiL (CAAX protease family)
MKSETPERVRLPQLAVVVVAWFAVTWLTPQLNLLVDLRSVNLWILPYLRMALMLGITWAFVAKVERLGFGQGFNLRFDRLGRAVWWAAIFFVITFAAEKAYAALVLNPLAHGVTEASSVGVSSGVRSLTARAFEYSYIVFEGIVEVLVFIGFLVDRLAKRWGWVASVLISNVIFALWHFPYWRMGALPGTLLVVQTFIAGVVISLNFRVTKSSLSSALCHFLVDSPSALRILLGRG